MITLTTIWDFCLPSKKKRGQRQERVKDEVWMPGLPSFYVRKKRLTSTQLRGRTLSVLDFLARPWCYHHVSPRANFPANCQWTKGWVQLSGLHLETKSMQSMLLTPRRHRKQRVLSRHARHYFWRRNDSELELSPKCKCVTASNKKTQPEDECANLYSVLARMTDESSSLWVPQSHSPLEDNYSTLRSQT